MDCPLVSVNIVTYNQEAYIAQAVEGALRQQTDFAVEIVVGEDCSTDGTRAILLEYQRQYPERLRVLTGPQNVGPDENLLRVWAASRGKYIAFCDGDDYWTDPRKLHKQAGFLEMHPDYALCCHDVEVVYDVVPAVGGKYVAYDRDTFSFEDEVAGHFIPTSSVVYRRDLLTTLPPWFNECLGSDLLIDMVLLDQGLGYYFHETMGIKRDNPGSVSRAPGRDLRLTEDFLRMYKRTDAHTEGRHRDILHRKIARLSLQLARRRLQAGRFISFFHHVLESFRYDGTAIHEAAKRRLALRGR